MPTDIDAKMRSIREDRDAIRAEQEKDDEPEFEQPDDATIIHVNSTMLRDMSGETWRDSYGNHSATALRRRAVVAGNGHDKHYMVDHY